MPIIYWQWHAIKDISAPGSGWVNSPTMVLVFPLCLIVCCWPGDNDQCSTGQLLICTWEPRSLSTNLCNPVYQSLKSHFLFILVQFLRQCHGVLSRGNDLKWGQFQWPLTRLGQQVEANVWKVKGDRPSSPLSIFWYILLKQWRDETEGRMYRECKVGG